MLAIHRAGLSSRISTTRGTVFQRQYSTAIPSKTFLRKDLTIELTKNKRPHTPDEELKFGKTFSDHMFEVEWDATNGWKKPRIVPYHNLSLAPSASSLHYAIQCFEGLKAYKDAQGGVRLFRPDMNAKRLLSSCQRIALPSFEVNEFLECMYELVRLEKDWIPQKRGYSLYIRPTGISTEDTLGVSPPSKSMLYIIASPVGPYYKSGFNPVKLLADPTFVRAAPGGTGCYKLGANYAPTIYPQKLAESKHYTQQLWTYGPNHQIAEVGTMNIFLFMLNKTTGKQELVTPKLDGTILPGVTRDSILQLTREWKEFDVTERDVTMPELIEAVRENRLLEMFGAGTAAVVSPVEAVCFQDVEYKIPLDKSDPQAKAGKLTSRIMNHLMGIQYGEIPHPWSIKLA